MSNIQQHFSIRKLTIGTSSVLIGLSFLGFTSQTAHADTNNAAAPIEQTASRTANAAANGQEDTDQAQTLAKAAGTTKTDEVKTTAPTTSGNEANIVIPDAADFRKDPRYTNITSLELKSGLLSHFINDVPGVKSISISKTGGEKVVASTDNSIWFNLMQNASSSLTAMDLSNVDTSRITNPSGMFGVNDYSQGHLEYLDLTGWDTSHFTTTAQMFQNQPLREIKGIGNWDTSNVTDMHNMFFCGSADGLGGGQLTNLDLSGWDTSNVKNMFSMFAGQRKLASLTGLSGWNTTNVTTMREMFAGDTDLKQIQGLSNFDLAKLTTTYQMFQDTHSLAQVDLSHNPVPTGLTDSAQMFARPGARLINLSNWNLSNANVTKMFAELQKPATILLNNVSVNYGTVTNRVVPTQLDIMAFAGTDDSSARMHLVVISDNPTFVRNINNQRIYYSPARPDDWEDARQNEDKFSLKAQIRSASIDLGTVPMDLAYPSARDVAVAVLHKIERRLQEYDVQNGTDYASRWLKSLDVENNQMKPATHRLAAELASYFSNGYENSLPASITGTYMLDLREEVDPDNGAGDNPDVNPGTKPATPTQPSKPVHPGASYSWPTCE